MSFPLFSTSNPLQLLASGAITDYSPYQDRSLQFGLAKVFVGSATIGLSTLQSWRRDYLTGETKLNTSLSNLFMRFELPRLVTVLPGVTYDHINHEVTLFQVAVTKSVTRNMFVSFLFFDSPVINVKTFSLNLQYRFPFVQTNATVSRSESFTSYSLLA